MIDWTLLRRKFGSELASRKFEKLAFQYVKDCYPDYTWIPTPPKNDGNRDAYVALDGEYEIREEAKYRNSVKESTHTKDRDLERKDIDSTILSGLIYGKVRLIIFVSNAKMPSSVMSRAMLGAKIRGIEVTCAMADQLESWLVQNQSVYTTIFEDPFPADSSVSSIIRFQKAQFYDLLSTDFLFLQQKKSFYTGELCMLGLVVYVSEPATALLRLSDAPFCVLAHPDYNGMAPIKLSAGLTNLVFLVRMQTPYTGRVNICLEINGKPFCQISNLVTVLAESRYSIAYAHQLEIISQIRQLLIEPKKFDQGMVITVYAESSMGKSYILRQILQEFGFKYDISMIEFDSNKNSQTNNLLLCKIVLFLCFGNIFWNIEDIATFKSQVLQANTKELFDNQVLSQLLDGCFDANIACSIIQMLSHRMEKERLLIIGGRRSKFPRILLLDDFQYLRNSQETFIRLLLKQLQNQHNSNIVIISATQGKFESADLESYFQELTPNHFTLNGLTQVDKSETLSAAFCLPPYSLTSVADRILPSSPLLAGEVLRIMGGRLSQKPDTLSVILAYTSQIDSPKLLQNKFCGFEDQFYLLDITYKFKKGIPIDLLENYSAFDKEKVQKDLNLLFAQNLITIHNGVIAPYHEYYITAYQQMRGEKIHSAVVASFLEYLLARSHQTKSIDVNQVLALLLRCGPEYAQAYKKQVKKYVLKYIHKTQFGAALQFCEYYYEQITPIGKRKLTHEESYFLYLYADCLVHCDHMNRAHEKLAEVYQYAQDDSLEKYEAGASLLNQFFWEVRPNKVLADSFSVQRGIERLPNTLMRGENKRRIIRSYESCFNRRMAAYLLTDQVEEARKIYLDRLKRFVTVGQKDFPSYSATIIMDYARGLSFFAPSESQRLMRLALRFFKTAANIHFRRIALCEVDVEVLNSIVEQQYHPKVFQKLKEKLLQNGFLSEYFKAVMKHTVCKWVDYAAAGYGSTVFEPNAQIFLDFEAELQECLLTTQLCPSGRELLLLNYIKAFIAARRNKLEQARDLLNACASILQEAGSTYQISIKHNLAHLEQVKTIAWCTDATKLCNDTFFIDSRFW